MIFKKNKKKDKKKDVPDTYTSISKITAPKQVDNKSFNAEDIDKIVEVWLKEIFVRFKTFYSSVTQVKAVTRTQTMADRYDVICIKNYLHELRITLLSLKGMTEKDLVDILRERINTMFEEKTTDKGLGKFLE